MLLNFYKDIVFQRKALCIYIFQNTSLFINKYDNMRHAYDEPVKRGRGRQPRRWTERRDEGLTYDDAMKRENPDLRPYTVIRRGRRGEVSWQNTSILSPGQRPLSYGHLLQLISLYNGAIEPCETIVREWIGQRTWPSQSPGGLICDAWIHCVIQLLISNYDFCLYWAHVMTSNSAIKDLTCQMAT